VHRRPAIGAIADVHRGAVLARHPDERRPNRVDDSQIGFGGLGEFAGVGQLVLEGEMDHAIGIGSRIAEAIKIIERSSSNLDARGVQGHSRRVSACESDDGVTGGEKIGNEEPMWPEAPVTKRRMGSSFRTDDIE